MKRKIVVVFSLLYINTTGKINVLLSLFLITLFLAVCYLSCYSPPCFMSDSVKVLFLAFYVSSHAVDKFRCRYHFHVVVERVLQFFENGRIVDAFFS